MASANPDGVCTLGVSSVPSDVPIGRDMNDRFPAPGSNEDMQLAARLVVDGVLPESTVRAVLAKSKELIERGKPLSVGDICHRKKWVTASEVSMVLAFAW